MENTKYDILSLTYEEVEKIVLELGEPKFRAKQIYGWIVKGMWGAEKAGGRVRFSPAKGEKKARFAN